MGGVQRDSRGFVSHSFLKLAPQTPAAVDRRRKGLSCPCENTGACCVSGADVRAPRVGPVWGALGPDPSSQSSDQSRSAPEDTSTSDEYVPGLADMSPGTEI